MGQSNLAAVLQTYLKDILFSEEEIIKNVELREHIFEIKNDESSLGFISLYDLKAYVFEHEDEAKNYSVKNIDSDEWKNIFEHPFFQRRKPQLLSADHLKNQDDDQQFFILRKGQKNGPYEKYELTEMLEEKEILLTDMVSSNAGHTWIKLYQVDGFERRTLKGSDELPGMPDSDFLSRPSSETNAISEATDAITSLAYLGNIKRGKSIEREKASFYQDEMAKKASTSSVYKWLLVLSVVGIGYFLWNIKSHLNSPFKESANPIGEQAEMLTPVETTSSAGFQPVPYGSNGVNDQRRMGKFETRKINPPRAARTPARKSFMETQKFRESNNASDMSAPAASDDNNYYYDNAAPMELDPVRAQISKENFDNATEPGQASENDPLFNQEVSN